MLVIREEIPWYEEKERGEVAAESTFCRQFSATSQCSSKRGEMQEGGGLNRGITQQRWKQPGGYFALHVSFAHITPIKTGQTMGLLRDSTMAFTTFG